MSTLTSARFCESWRALGLGESLPELIEAHRAVLARISEQERDAAAATARARRERAEHVAGSGKSTKLAALPDPIDFDRARDLAERAFQRDVRALGDSLVAELADAHAGILAEAETLVPLIGNLQTDAQALARTTTTEAREAWARLGALWQDRKTLLSLLTELLHAEVIEDARLPLESQALMDYRRFRCPDGARPAGGSTFIIAGRKTTPDARLMARLIENAPATEPGIYTLAEAKRHLAEDKARVKAELRAKRAEAQRPTRKAVRAVG